MRILQVEKYYWPKGGASKYALDLSSELENAGEIVVPFAAADVRNLPSRYSQYFVPSFDYSSISRISFFKKAASAINILYSVRAKNNLNSLLNKEKIDVAHLHNIYHQISPSIFSVLKKRDIPTVMTLHDYKLVTPNYSFFHHGAIHEEDAEGWYLSCIKNKCFKDSRFYSCLVTAEMIFHHKLASFYRQGVDRFLAPSQFIKNIFVKYGWPADKILHLPLPVDVADKVTSPGRYVAYLGRLVEEKGVKELCQAALKTPQIPYKIIGEGPLSSFLREFISEHNIKNVELSGFKQGRELESIMEGTRLLVAPSIWYENCPLSVLEAKALGKVVVASEIGGLPEMLPKDMLVKPGDVNSLAENISFWYEKSDQDLLAVGESLRDDVRQKNNPETHRDRILQIYRDLKAGN